MATEIERKFLLQSDDWKQDAARQERYCQGYLVGSAQASVRVRIQGGEARLNIKSATLGVSRQEFEYAIPVADAEELLRDLCQKPLIEKTRYFVPHEGMLWESDQFEGDNEGLVVAEIELDSEQQTFSMPSWVGQEVSQDRRYYNVCLVTHPYKDWIEEA